VTLDDNLPAFLAGLPDHLFGLTLLFCRVSAAVMLVPGWAETEAPRMVRAGLAVAFTLLLYPPLARQMPDQPGMAETLGMIAAELAAGGLLGWLARLTALALPLAGQFASIQLGAQSAPLGQMFSRALPVLVLATGLYRLPLAALAGSYAVLPAGGFFSAGDAARLVVQAVGHFWLLGVQLASPFLFAGLLWHGALGLVSRLVPKVQIFSVSAPGQILGGLTLCAMLVSEMLRVWADQVSAAWAALPGY